MPNPLPPDDSIHDGGPPSQAEQMLVRSSKTLLRLQYDLNAALARIENLSREVHGSNGHEGIKIRMTRLEEKYENVARVINWIAGVAAGALVAAVSGLVWMSLGGK